MIVSASYKTDIPAFYGEWFEKRLEAGYCMVANPYNRRQVRRVSLLPEDVDGFVFWTKNLGPFTVQYTITGYLRDLERTVVDADRSIRLLRTVSDRYGPKAAVWRYDPILFSSLTPAEYHLENFERLAGALEKSTDEVVISFATIYKKTARNLDAAARDFGFMWEDPADEVKLGLAAKLVEIAKSHGMKLSVCSQRKYVVSGAQAARCVDARRLAAMEGRPIRARLKGNRSDCGCYESVDIGEYDTCPHGCAYCYAVLHRDVALKRYKSHDSKGEFLFSPNDDGSSNRGEIRQTTLF
jgi:hypothetical protein